MAKFFLTSFLAVFCFYLKAQEPKLTGRVMLSKDSIPVFDKMYSSNVFTKSFFYCRTDFSGIISNSQFESFNSSVKGHNIDIASFISTDGKSIVSIFPKHTIRGIKEFYGFLENHFNQNSFPGVLNKSIKHVEVVEAYDPLDKNRGFN